MTSLKEVALFLKNHDNYRILCHHNPDGDTIGSAFALATALRKIGKKAHICCSDDFSEQYNYMINGEEVNKDIPYETVVTVDIADKQLIGGKYNELGDNVDLLIDHHYSNTRYAKNCYVDSTAAANCEIIYDLICELGVEIDKHMADCIYTGLSTDTGCFRYSNVTERTHLVACETIKAGADHAGINKVMFETKSLRRIKIERMVLNSLQLYYDDKLATLFLTQDMMKKTGAREDELEGVAAIPREIEGVLIGILFREKPDGSIRVSLRTNEPVDASAICAAFGGGGHKRAAGCTFNTSIEEAREKIVEEVGKILQ